jgi:hypothetical protein
MKTGPDRTKRGFFSYSNLDYLQLWFDQRRWLVIVCIVLFQAGLYIFSLNNPVFLGQLRTKTSGFSHNRAQQYLYHYYYNDLFPVVSLKADKEYSQSAAENLLYSEPDSLVMEYEHWARLGENARIWAYLPNAWARGSPEKPTIKLFNALFFTLALIICFLGFARSKRILLGMALVLVASLTPYFIYETLGRDNVFAYLAALFLMVLGMNAGLLFGKSTSFKGWLIPILTGLVIGFISELRNEVTIVVGVAVLIYSISANAAIWQRIVRIALMILVFIGTKSMIKDYFDMKWDEAHSVVTEAGGHPYDGPRIEGHIVWHAVFCGLGDFDTKYGYEWNDKVAYRYATPILNSKYGMDIDYSEGYHPNNYYDEAEMYYVKFDDIPEYEEVMKEKVLGDIGNDPGWYISILLKRVVRTFHDTIPFKTAGWLTLLLAFFLVRKKMRDEWMLLFLSLPLSFTPLAIYSGDHATYNSMFPVVGISLLLLFVVNAILAKKLRSS